MNIVLANAAYSSHTSSEGDQLQNGLACAGWRLCGPYYDAEGGDTKALIAKYDPKIVFVQDFRDWDMNSKGAFGRRDLHFRDIDYLRTRPDIFKVCVVKDAGTAIEYQREMCDRVGANAVVTYYHRESVLRLSPWLAIYPLIRTYHTVDACIARNVEWPTEREVGIVTGATNQRVYPVRHMIFHHAASLGITAHKHPGYGDKKCHTTEYLELLSRYRVHVATCSEYKFALRKIMESVAVGCVPMTNLPDYDPLPEIQGALAPLPDVRDMYNLKRTIRQAATYWNEKERREWAEKCLAFYDFRAMGKRLSDDIERTCREFRGH